MLDATDARERWFGEILDDPGSAHQITSSLLPSNVAPAPFQFLPDHAEEGNSRQRSQRQDLIRFPDRNNRPGLHPKGLPAVHRQEDRTLALADLNFDERIFAHDD